MNVTNDKAHYNHVGKKKRTHALKLVLSLVVVFLFLCSCVGTILPDNSGFPRKVFLHAEGETHTIKGADLYGLSIGEGNPSSEWDGESPKTEIYASNTWLTVKYNRQTSEMTITAKPNDSRKVRSTTICGMVLDSNVDIQVYQGK